jgi:membrane-associated protease RseP (regulator of RpoE activity)
VHAGSSILLALMYQLANGGELGEAVIRLSPVAFAGWIGLFVTALNLLPVGQLDGGHIAYGLFGQRWARRISVGAFLLMLALGLTVWPGLFTWAFLIALIAGFSHMPALDDVTPPDARRFVLGAVALALLVLIVVPLPSGMRGLMLDCPYM